MRALVMLLLFATAVHGREVCQTLYRHPGYRVGKEYVIAGRCPGGRLAKLPPERVRKLLLNVYRPFVVRFALDSAEIDERQIKRLVAYARSHRGMKVKVFGYTCWLGGKKHNDRLAKRRAEVVAEVLKRYGVKVVGIYGRGKCCYVDKRNPEPNRRVEIVVVP